VNRPLENVTITVDGMEETLRTTTDAQGSFTLAPAPPGRFFVKIDGRTAKGSQWLNNGAYYPYVGKAGKRSRARRIIWPAARPNLFASYLGGYAAAVSMTGDTTISFHPQ